jgi:hypothetical protein
MLTKDSFEAGFFRLAAGGCTADVFPLDDSELCLCDPELLPWDSELCFCDAELRFCAAKGLLCLLARAPT